MKSQLNRNHTDSTTSANVPKIGIVGGGPGGLMSAYFLQKKIATPIEITIFEASSRLGGKIQTLEFESANVKYEAGAAEFYDYSGIDHDSLKELIGELGLMMAPMGGNTVVLDDKIMGTLDEVELCLGSSSRRELERFYWRARSLVSTSEFYDSQGEEAPPLISTELSFDDLLNEIRVPGTRRYIERMMHSDLATSPGLTNITYGLHNFLMNDNCYMQLYGIVGGNEQLVEALQAAVSARFCLNTYVSRIYRLQSGKIKVEFSTSRNEESGNRSADQMEASEFDYLITALPLDRLQKVEFGGTVLNTAVQEHIQHFDHPAHYLRITILFERPFWQAVLADSFCMLEAFGGCCLYDESSRVLESKYGVLGWLLAGEAAANHAEYSDEKLIDLALDSLPSIFSEARDFFMEGKVHRWLGAVNGMPGGRTYCPLDRRHQPEPLHHRNLFLVGDYLFDSTVNGVLESAEYVTDWIASDLNAST